MTNKKLSAALVLLSYECEADQRRFLAGAEAPLLDLPSHRCEGNGPKVTTAVQKLLTTTRRVKQPSVGLRLYLGD
jgi:hypothetical protein